MVADTPYLSNRNSVCAVVSSVTDTAPVSFDVHVLDSSES